MTSMKEAGSDLSKLKPTLSASSNLEQLLARDQASLQTSVVQNSKPIPPNVSRPLHISSEKDPPINHTTSSVSSIVSRFDVVQPSSLGHEKTRPTVPPRPTPYHQKPQNLMVSKLATQGSSHPESRTLHRSPQSPPSPCSITSTVTHPPPLPARRSTSSSYASASSLSLNSNDSDALITLPNVAVKPPALPKRPRPSAPSSKEKLIKQATKQQPMLPTSNINLTNQYSKLYDQLHALRSPSGVVETNSGLDSVIVKKVWERSKLTPSELRQIWLKSVGESSRTGVLKSQWERGMQLIDARLRELRATS